MAFIQGSRSASHPGCSVQGWHHPLCPRNISPARAEQSGHGLGGKLQQNLALDRLHKANLFKPFPIEKPDYHLPYDAFLSLQQYQKALL